MSSKNYKVLENSLGTIPLAKRYVDFTTSLYAGDNATGTYNCVIECDVEETPVVVNNGTGTTFGWSITNSAGQVVAGGGSDFDGTVC